MLKRSTGKGAIIRGRHIQVMVNRRRVYMHRLIVEQVLGKRLPAKAVVHHVNGNGLDNRKCNLVVCPDQSYHRLIEFRTAQHKLMYPEQWES